MSLHSDFLAAHLPWKVLAAFSPMCSCIVQLETDRLGKNEMVRYGSTLPFGVQ